jgi:hypothetical protein
VGKPNLQRPIYSYGRNAWLRYDSMRTPKTFTADVAAARTSIFTSAYVYYSALFALRNGNLSQNDLIVLLNTTSAEEKLVDTTMHGMYCFDFFLP